jgi:hypothetical protein
MRNHLLLCTLLIGGGCYIGERVEIPSLAYRPTGTTVRIQMADGEIDGELLALRPGEFIVLTSNPNRLLVVPAAGIRSGNAILAGEFQTADLGNKSLERLRRLSRFPQGIDDELEASLLRAYGLTRMEKVEP